MANTRRLHCSWQHASAHGRGAHLAIWCLVAVILHDATEGRQSQTRRQCHPALTKGDAPRCPYRVDERRVDGAWGEERMVAGVAAGDAAGLLCMAMGLMSAPGMSSPNMSDPPPSMSDPPPSMANPSSESRCMETSASGEGAGVGAGDGSEGPPSKSRVFAGIAHIMDDTHEHPAWGPRRRRRKPHTVIHTYVPTSSSPETDDSSSNESSDCSAVGY